jgi:uncharacterized protein YukE
MADGAPGNPSPVTDDPVLEVLTFDQLTQLVNEVTPDAFYQRAAAFDQAAVRLQDVLDQIRHQLNLVQEVWTGGVSEEFDNLARENSGRITVVLQFLQNPGYGSILRAAGDALAAHQQRFRDLQGQKAQQESTPPALGAPPPEVTAQVNNQSAKQILRDLCTAYQDIGNAMAPLPYTVPQAITTPAEVVPAAADTAPVVAAPSSGSGAGGLFGFGDTAGQVLGRSVSAGEVSAGSESGFQAETAPAALSGLRQETAPAVPTQTWSVPLPLMSPAGGVLVAGVGVPVCQVPAGSGSGLRRETAPAALGQTRSAPPPMSHVGAVPVAFAGVSPPVLGRPEMQPDAGRTDKPVSKGAYGGRKAVEEARRPQPGNPETAPAEAPIAPVDQDTDAVAVKTAADAPQATAPLAGEVAVWQMDPGERVDPGERGMFVPTAGTAAGGGASQNAAQPYTDPAATSHLAHGGPAGPADPHASQTGGYPMSPAMLGGMSGRPAQQNGRIAAVPNAPRPEFWDSPDGTPTVLGRRERKPEVRETELSRADAQAMFTEKFSELDRLIDRGN